MIVKVDLKWVPAEERDLYLRYVAAFYGLDDFVALHLDDGAYILDRRDLKAARELIDRGQYVEADIETMIRAFRAAAKTAPLFHHARITGVCVDGVIVAPCGLEGIHDVELALISATPRQAPAPGRPRRRVKCPSCGQPGSVIVMLRVLHREVVDGRRVKRQCNVSDRRAREAAAAAAEAALPPAPDALPG
ncbi:MAG: hypothetical protein QXU69_09605 [Thermofilaceae archaeon]